MKKTLLASLLAFGALTSAQVASLSTVQLAALDASLVDDLSTAAVKGLSTVQMVALSSDQIAALTSAQLGALSAAQVAAIEAAMEEQRKPSAQATLALHQAEQWRDRLIADDDALNTWLQAHAPGVTLAAPDTLAESLAGRAAFLDLQGFSLQESRAGIDNEADALPRGRILHYGRAMGRLQ